VDFKILPLGSVLLRNLELGCATISGTKQTYSLSNIDLRLHGIFSAVHEGKAYCCVKSLGQITSAFLYCLDVQTALHR